MNKATIPATDEAWDERVLGSDEAYVEIADESLTESVDKAAGTQLISMRVSKSMIDDFKAIAAQNGGIGYQTLMKQILQRFIDSEKRQVWNEYVSKKLKEQNSNTAASGKPRAKSRERKAA